MYVGMGVGEAQGCPLDFWVCTVQPTHHAKVGHFYFFNILLVAVYTYIISAEYRYEVETMNQYLYVHPIRLRIFQVSRMKRMNRLAA